MNQMCIISLPFRSVSPGPHAPSGPGVRPRLSPFAQTRCQCQRVIGPPGDDAVLAARHAEHDADEDERLAGSVGVDDHLGPPRGFR